MDNSKLKIKTKGTSLTFNGGYPITSSPYHIKGIGQAPTTFLDTIGVSVDLVQGAQFEKCVSKLKISSFNDGLQVFINGDTILYFNQSHWDPAIVIGASPNNTKNVFGPNGMFDIDGSGTVSYTHLTLPTKRIV